MYQLTCNKTATTPSWWWTKPNLIPVFIPVSGHSSVHWRQFFLYNFLAKTSRNTLAKLPSEFGFNLHKCAFRDARAPRMRKNVLCRTRIIIRHKSYPMHRTARASLDSTHVSLRFGLVCLSVPLVMRLATLLAAKWYTPQWAPARSTAGKASPHYWVCEQTWSEMFSLRRVLVDHPLYLSPCWGAVASYCNRCFAD